MIDNGISQIVIRQFARLQKNGGADMENNRNYYKRFEEQIENAALCEEKPTLLLHACCAPCSSHVLELLNQHFAITVFFYNPNIDTEAEYGKRLEELLRFTEQAPFAKDIPVIDGSYEKEYFEAIAKGREQLPERGARCYDCYLLRMKKAAEYALCHKFDYFTTTLSISPHKNADWINDIGIRLEEELSSQSCEKSPVFLYSDFKKKNGYARSICLSKEYGLYRQNYCGCRYSRMQREETAPKC